MIDFLRAFPNVSRDEYLWSWTVPQIRLSMCDNTHIEYLTERQASYEQARRCGRLLDGDSISIQTDLGMDVI